MVISCKSQQTRTIIECKPVLYQGKDSIEHIYLLIIKKNKFQKEYVLSDTCLKYGDTFDEL